MYHVYGCGIGNDFRVNALADGLSYWVYIFIGVREKEREKECVCVYVCMRESVCVFERESVCVCVQRERSYVKKRMQYCVDY